MTTPAVNVDTTHTDYSGKTIITTEGYPPNVISGGLVTYDRKYRRRPASQSRPFVPTPQAEWRGMTPWEHSWGSGKVVSGRDGFIRHGDLPPGSVRSQMWTEGSMWPTPLSRPAPPDEPFGLQSRCEIKALADLQHSDFRLGTFLAEGREAISMVGSRAEKIASGVRRFATRFPRRWRDVKRWQRGLYDARDWKKIPQSWLELQYGWNPLLSDILGALHHLQRQPAPPLIKAVGSGGDSLTRSFDKVGVVSPFKLRHTQDWEFRSQCILYYRLRNPVLAEISSLGLLNPLEICWERLPYSFVVDWFAPIGPWLQALTADVGFDFLGGCYSMLARCTERCTNVTPRTQGLFTCQVETSTEWEEGFARRRLYPSAPVPGIYVKNPLSLKHFANAMSLLATAFR